MRTKWLGATLALAMMWTAGCGVEPDDMDVMDEIPPTPTETIPAMGTPEYKTFEATSAGPEQIAHGATIMDWPPMEGGEPTVLRQGSNGWTCFPTMPTTAARGGRDPMCVDGTFIGWANALMTNTTPVISGVGLAYMLAGDGGASNVDPYAEAPTPTNEWVQTGPHVMMVSPDPALLQGITTDPTSGGPFVMWRGTPYAHVMMPVAKTP